MKIVVYIDESGIHDLLGKEVGAKVAVLAGYGGFENEWVNFCGAWQTALNRYKIKKFHFHEYSDKRNSLNNPDWPYYGWSDAKRHDFLFELASIAGSRSRIPFAAAFRLAHFHSDPDIKNKLRAIGLTDAQVSGPNVIYLSIFAECFEAFSQELKTRLADFTDSISFVFDDRKGNKDWAIAGHDVHRIFKEKDQRFIDSPTFSDTFTNIPLQAADMMAYRAHQIWENEHKTGKTQEFSKLDLTMWGNFKDVDELKRHLRFLFNRNAILESRTSKRPLSTRTGLVLPPWGQTQ